MESTFLFLNASRSLVHERASLEVASEELDPFTKKIRISENTRAGIDSNARAGLQPILVSIYAAIKGVNVNAREGIDWLSPSIRPRFEGSVAAVTTEAPTGCWGLLPMPPMILNPKNWMKPLLNAAKMFITALIRLPTPMSILPLVQRRRYPTNIWGNPVAKVLADRRRPSWE